MPDSGTVPEAITPAAERPGERQSFSFSDSSRAYYTGKYEGPPQRAPIRSAEEMGWGWAKEASRKQGETGVMGRPVVHDVEPEGKIDVDLNLNRNGTQGAELTADRLKVTGTGWIRPPNESELGVQGTLPHINWNQHVGKHGSSVIDYNNVGISGWTGQTDVRPRNNRQDAENMDAKVAEARTQARLKEHPTLF